jgi:hypothetical protein
MSLKNQIYNLIWDWTPVFLGFVAFIVFNIWRSFIYDYNELITQIDEKKMYSSVFGWSTVQSGFLFASYGFFASASSKFFDYLKRTDFILRLLDNVRSGTASTFILAFCSIPLMVLEPDWSSSSPLLLLLIGIWLGIVSWATAEFLRILFVFWRITAPKHRGGEVPRDKDNRPAVRLRPRGKD